MTRQEDAGITPFGVSLVPITPAQIWIRFRGLKAEPFRLDAGGESPAGQRLMARHGLPARLGILLENLLGIGLLSGVELQSSDAKDEHVLILEMAHTNGQAGQPGPRLHFGKNLQQLVNAFQDFAQIALSERTSLEMAYGALEAEYAAVATAEEPAPKHRALLNDAVADELLRALRRITRVLDLPEDKPTPPPAA